jgi:DNA-binding CsgD family transcriptional regulator
MLAPGDRQELLLCLRVIGEAGDVIDFAVRTCREMLRLVPGLSASYNEINTVAQRINGIVYPDPGREWFERYGPILHQHMFDNPLIAHYEATGEGDVRTWTDLDPDGTFRKTALYRKFYAPNGIDNQIAFAVPSPPGIHIGLVVNRDGAEFDARERALLSELRPHLANIYRLVSYADASRHQQAALADDGWSVVLVDDDGVVLESNPAAVAIGRAAGTDLDVGARLAETGLWSAMIAPTGDLWARSRPGAPTKVLSGQRAFEARLQRSPVYPHLLWIREPSRVTERDAVALGLTERQAQVAVLLEYGLTNVEIAAKLGITSGTVRKHLEAIFDRLGVRSRAAVVGRLRSVG